MMYEKSLETLSRDELRKIQNENLLKMLKRIENVPFYKKKFEEKGINVNDIKSMDQLKDLPFTTKQDLRDNYPFGLFAAPQKEIVRIHASSGTTGKPTVVGYTKNDIKNWGKLVARGICCANGDENSIVQVAYGYGLFTGGLGFHYGVEELGASVVPMSGGNSAKQIMLMEDFGTTILGCTPSYALYMGEYFREKVGDLSRIKLKAGIFGAEPWTNDMRKQIENVWGIKAYDIYGLSEIMGPGVAIECECQNGLHIWEDHFIAEIIDSKTGEVLPYGEEGELVVTTITKEGIPLLRYRTRDLSKLYVDKCACGRTHARIERIKARSDDMLIIRGVNVFPSQIESILLSMEGLEPHYQLVVTREGILDNLEVKVEVNPKMFEDTISSLETLEKTLRNNIKSVLGISAKVKLVEPYSIPRFEGKAQRVIDERGGK